MLDDFDWFGLQERRSPILGCFPSGTWYAEIVFNRDQLKHTRIIGNGKTMREAIRDLRDRLTEEQEATASVR